MPLGLWLPGPLSACENFHKLLAWVAELAGVPLTKIPVSISDTSQYLNHWHAYCPMLLIQHWPIAIC